MHVGFVIWSFIKVTVERLMKELIQVINHLNVVFVTKLLLVLIIRRNMNWFMEMKNPTNVTFVTRNFSICKVNNDMKRQSIHSFKIRIKQDFKKSMTARFRFIRIFRMKKIHKIQNDIMNEIQKKISNIQNDNQVQNWHMIQNEI